MTTPHSSEEPPNCHVSFSLITFPEDDLASIGGTHVWWLHRWFHRRTHAIQNPRVTIEVCVIFEGGTCHLDTKGEAARVSNKHNEIHVTLHIERIRAKVQDESSFRVHFADFVSSALSRATIAASKIKDPVHAPSLTAMVQDGLKAYLGEPLPLHLDESEAPAEDDVQVDSTEVEFFFTFHTEESVTAFSEAVLQRGHEVRVLDVEPGEGTYCSVTTNSYGESWEGLEAQLQSLCEAHDGIYDGWVA